MKHKKGDDEGLSDTEINPEVTPMEAGSGPSEEPSYSQRTWAEVATSSFLLLTCLASLAVAALGFALLVYIFFSRSFAPPKAHLVKNLYFDYADSSAFASASFLDSTFVKGSESTTRAFLPGQQMNVWLELEAAEGGASVNTDLFQVLAQLLTADGKTAATASRPCLLTSWSPFVQSIRSLISTPMVLLGLWREQQTLKVPLFSRYPDQADRPFVAFKAVLRATTKGGHLPHLYSARVHVDLVLGLFGRLIYWLRPGKFMTLGLAASALAAMGGGTLVALTCFLYWFFTAPKAHAPSHSPPHSEADDDSDTDLPSPAKPSPSRQSGQGQQSSPQRGVSSQQPSPVQANRGTDGGARSGLNSWVEDETLQIQLEAPGGAGLTHRRVGAQLI